MFAIVARTASFRRGHAPGRRAARVTHALLLIAVTAVPPGVRGACTGCPSRGGREACCTGPSADAAAAGVAAAVAATHCCGSHASADPGPPTDASSADRGLASSVADAADGGPLSPAGCRCAAGPRDRTGDGVVPRPAAAVAALPSAAGIAAAVVSPPMNPAAAATFAPARPFRVLYGVWRN